MPPPATRYAPPTIGTIAANASQLGICPTANAATASANTGDIVSSGDVRAAPILRWLMFRNVQPSRKCTIPAVANAASAQPSASRTRPTSSVATASSTSAAAAIATFRNVETYGSSMSRTARRLRLWKSPNPMPEAAAHSAAVTRTPRLPA